MNLQQIIQTSFKAIFCTVETVSPGLAGKWAVRLFFRPARHKRPQREVVWLREATIERVSFNGFYKRPDGESAYTLYEWGTGPAVLLVHGWAGRGSQMGALVAPLVEAGYRVVAFDAPAHGDSPGKVTNLIEVSQVIKDIEGRVGGFQAVIGHSFGGVAAAFAVTEGVQTERLVTVGSPASMGFIFRQFATQIGASAKTVTHLETHLQGLTNRPIDEFSLANLVQKMAIPGLIVHDRQDKEVAYSQAIELAERWPGGHLMETESLGHRRILRDPAVISKVVNFVTAASQSAEMSPIQLSSTMPHI